VGGDGSDGWKPSAGVWCYIVGPRRIDLTRSVGSIWCGWCGLPGPVRSILNVHLCAA
jgi:hypothetical protein